MTKEFFRFSTAILSRLGEELNPNLDQGILELVKNSYDADAKKCVVELIKTAQTGGTIKIVDDGIGMTKEVIRDGWLVLGRSAKTSNNVTKSGRLQVGNKGLGRLAALRMGEIAKIETFPEAKPNSKYTLTLNWNRFDNANVVEEVPIDLIEGDNENATPSGTTITIEGLKSSLAKKDVHELARALVLLADPFDNPSSFRPILRTPEFEDLEKIVERRYFDDSEFHLVASIDKSGKVKASVTDYKGKELFSAKHQDISVDEVTYNSPPASFEMWIFILDQATFSVRNSTLKEVKQWLTQFGGVHLYHRGLRVHPYGDPGHDWLDMNLRRAQNPELRPSTNTCIGKITISDPKSSLVQKTDRSGFIENENFKELKRFAVDTLEWIARQRIRERERERTRKRQESPAVSAQAKTKIDDIVKSLPAKERGKVKKAFNNYERAKEQETKTLVEEVQLYRTLSTVGTTSATFAHETKNSLETIVESAGTIQRRGEQIIENYSNTFKKPVERILASTEALHAFSASTLSMLEHEKRRRSRVQIHTTLDKVIDLFKPFFDDRQIQPTKQYATGNPFLMGSEAALEAVIINLITNSVRALEEFSGQRTIHFRTNLEKDDLLLRVLDSGPGIKGLSKHDIWLPGQTTYPNGTGLGLTIVRDAVIDLGGKVDVVEKGELGGAEFIIQLPILGV